jgi:hypothetical protein
MANTFVLGGSPLGLIGVRSRPTADGMSTFNGGESRNVNVTSYNIGRKQDTNISIGGSNLQSTVSLFTGGSLPQFWANISSRGTEEDTTGLARGYKGINRSVLHNNEVYDTSILNIIEKLSFSNKAALRPQDFAYLKNLGVFPNNRLIIARRFAEPQSDNIFDKGGSGPLSVLISWKPEDEDFISFTYGEEWEEADADFTGVLNKMGENFRIKGTGDGLGKGLNITPLPGFTELLQRKLLAKLGIIEDSSTGGSDSLPLPSGNPNIIKEAKRRKTIGYGQRGSGLKASFSIKMKVEYEQKFISGIDPTIAWMDILNNALIFGTSNSDNYGLSPIFKEKIKSWTGEGGIKRLIKEILESLTSIVKDLKGKISEVVSFISDAIGAAGESTEGESQSENTDKKSIIDKLGLTAANVGEQLLNSVQAAISKYKVELLGITHALSGLPSTPWHVTIGNPLRPTFCSGDMLVSDIALKMGPTLAFNDLPSTMTIELELKNARNLGLQEILAKFNTGYLRVVNVRKDYLTSEFGNSNNNLYYDNIDIGSNNTTGASGANPGSLSDNTNSTQPTTTKENA